LRATVLNGVFVFESITPDSDPGDPTSGVYFSPGTFDVRFGPLSFHLPLAEIEVLDREVDRYSVAAISGPFQFQASLQEGSPSAFADDLLPLSPPALSDFPNPLFVALFQESPSSGFLIQFAAELTSFRVSQPHAILLVVLALLSIAYVRRGRT
jgi:hypothetical protein